MPDETSLDVPYRASRRRPFDHLPALNGSPAYVWAWRRRATAATRVGPTVAGRTISWLVREAFMVLALAGVLVITVMTAWLVAS